MSQIEAGAEVAAQQFQVLEQSLGERQYVAGNGFTMGDIGVGVYAYRWYALDVKRPRLPRVEGYYERLTRRPAFQKHIMQPLT
jgi:glutathione S-transferase